MITKEDAITLGIFGGVLYHARYTQGRGKNITPLRTRVNGKCRTWKRQLERWELPVKYGFRICFTITPDGFGDARPEMWFPANLAEKTRYRMLAERLGVQILTPAGVLDDMAKDAGLIACDA